jgi:hypothetical protein
MSFSALEPDNLFSYTDIAKKLAALLESKKTCETDSLRKSILTFLLNALKGLTPLRMHIRDLNNFTVKIKTTNILSVFIF